MQDNILHREGFGVKLLGNLHDLINIREYDIVSIRKIPVLGGGK